MNWWVLFSCFFTLSDIYINLVWETSGWKWNVEFLQDYEYFIFRRKCQTRGLAGSGLKVPPLVKSVNTHCLGPNGGFMQMSLIAQSWQIFTAWNGKGILENLTGLQYTVYLTKIYKVVNLWQVLLLYMSIFVAHFYLLHIFLLTSDELYFL